MSKRILPVIACVLLVVCASPGPSPNSGAFSKNVTLFSYEGYTFAAQVRRGRLQVKVPCCQTYLADVAFRILMLEAVEQRLGCAPAEPEFTDGWVGTWQLTARFACARETEAAGSRPARRS